jgi:DNA-binding protein H-NS
MGKKRGIAVTNIGMLEAMSADDLWELHQKLSATLHRKIAEEKAKLEERLRKLPAPNVVKLESVRRPYPPVVPKYQNPDNPSVTWSGRGKQPLWLQAQLREGKKLEQFLIRRTDKVSLRRTG